MIYRSYNKETKLAIATMLTIFNNIVISRYDKEGEESKKITVPCKYAAESKIVKSLRSKNKVVPLPIISVARTSLDKDEDRVCDIHRSFFTQNDISYLSASSTAYDYRRNFPQPMTLGFSVKIWTAYEEDLNQILGNFIPFFNPYICVSSYHPYDKTQIMRSKIIWDGSIDTELPDEVEIDGSSDYMATINFVFQTWFWFGNEADKYSELGNQITGVTTTVTTASGNVNDGDIPDATQWVDDDGNILEGLETGNNVNDGYEVGENEFVDETTGEIYTKTELGVDGSLKDGFFITIPEQTLERLNELIDMATTIDELPYREQPVTYYET